MKRAPGQESVFVSCARQRACPGGQPLIGLTGAGISERGPRRSEAIAAKGYLSNYPRPFMKRILDHELLQVLTP